MKPSSKLLRTFFGHTENRRQVPGLSGLPLMLLGAAVGGLSYWLIQKEKEVRKALQAASKAAAAAEAAAKAVEEREAALKEEVPPPEEPDSDMYIPMVTPVTLEVSADLSAFVDPSVDEGRFLDELIPFMRDGLFTELGVRFPGIRVRRNPSLKSASYLIFLHEVPLVSGEVRLEHVLVNESAERLKLLGIEGIPTVNPATMQPACWISNTHADAMRSMEAAVWNIPEFLILHLSAVLKRYAPDFVDVQEVQRMLDGLDKVFPVLIRETIPHVLSLVKLTEILKRLVDEGVSIRDMRGILQAVAENGHQEKEIVMLTERVRIALRRSIASQHARGGKQLLVYLLDGEIERMIQESIQHDAGGAACLAMAPDAARGIIEAVKRECGAVSLLAQRPVILTKMRVRRYVYALLAHEFNPPLPVISHHELSPEIQVRPMVQIMLSPPAPTQECAAESP